MISPITPKLTLVGAGPGDPELITLKGILALGKADVILYDALVDQALLKHATENAIKIFVGKRHGYKQHPQQDTNKLIVEYAMKHGHVVRLKGGDPFVFGRGAEEIDYVQQFGIETEVIPGITSSISVPANQGIPVTKRGVSESFWVITGTTSSGQLSRDVQLATQSTATVVILMGTRKLPEIVAAFGQAGRENTPIALIQSGTTAEEKVVAGHIHDIEHKVQTSGIGAPAVIIIGDVVRESPKLMDVYRAAISV
ncbi:uroporphyrinogen-III C-methyltransferase [Echinicola strongylocentroti]|uniref:uroporphyrinogen-III C-methyltransferase n=1 Tax=Echinicola strongylocentroti TaxID=1795355 RepID=A0A2Z4IIJ8_9BACT|nr:uroporphyrinogen-III C-methyltransferase [Echinicola strongylocentroti]AWW30559.1 uroporphyrinogen-III C-methyltransferase [Echinicola strongylocentroti]